jgi:hypothetical protein
VWFYNYSTFTGRHGIYLEDLERTKSPAGNTLNGTPA